MPMHTCCLKLLLFALFLHNLLTFKKKTRAAECFKIPISKSFLLSLYCPLWLISHPLFPGCSNHYLFNLHHPLIYLYLTKLLLLLKIYYTNLDAQFNVSLSNIFYLLFSFVSSFSIYLISSLGK